MPCYGTHRSNRIVRPKRGIFAASESVLVKPTRFCAQSTSDRVLEAWPSFAWYGDRKLGQEPIQESTGCEHCTQREFHVHVKDSNAHKNAKSKNKNKTSLQTNLWALGPEDYSCTPFQNICAVWPSFSASMQADVLIHWDTFQFQIIPHSQNDIPAKRHLLYSSKIVAKMFVKYSMMLAKLAWGYSNRFVFVCAEQIHRWIIQLKELKRSWGCETEQQPTVTE